MPVDNPAQSETSEIDGLSSAAPQSILVIDPCSMEEAVISTPAYEAIATKYGMCTTALLTRQDNALLLRGDPNFSDVFGIPELSRIGHWVDRRSLRMLFALRRSDFDCAIDLAGTRESRFFTHLNGAREVLSIAGDSGVDAGFADAPATERLEAKMAFLGRLGCPSRRRRPVIVPSEGDTRYVLDLLRGTGLGEGGHFLVFAPAPSWWQALPPNTLARAVDRMYVERPGLVVIYAGSTEMKDYIDEAVSAGATRPSVLYLTPGHFAAFAETCDLIVGAEGLQLLLATAVGTRTVGVFGNAGLASEADEIGVDTLVAVVRENFASATQDEQVEPRRRFYETEAFRKTHRDANMFLHTAP